MSVTGWAQKAGNRYGWGLTKSAPGASGGSNLPFDDRIEFSTNPWVARLARGHIQKYDNGLKRVVGPKFYFLFNPNQISVSYGVHGSAKPTDEIDPEANKGGVGGPSEMGLGFKLMFDRSYEVAYNGSKQGVLKDVETLENMCGITNLRPFLTKVEIFRFVMGHNFVFYAWIERLGVEYINFSQDMVPMRCSIEIGATVYAVEASEKANMTHTGHGAPKPPKPKRRGRPRAKSSRGRRGRRR